MESEIERERERWIKIDRWIDRQTDRYKYSYRYRHIDLDIDICVCI